MKILYLITKSELGGAQTHVYQLMEHMKRNGHEVGLMAYPGGWLEEKAHALDVTFYPNIFFANSYSPFQALRAIKAIQIAVKSFLPDIVHCHSSAAGFFGRIALRGKVPTVFTAHSWAFTDGAPFIRKFIALFIERLVSHWTKKIICVSQFDKKLALRYRIAPKEKLIVIYNGVEVPPAQLTERKELVEVLFVGRLAYPKKLALLVESFEALPLTIRDRAVLRIIGDGPEKKALQSLVSVKGLEHRIILSGTVDHRQVLRLMQTADIFILLSKHEGLPMTILEAMGCSLPVIASNVGGIPEEVDETTGILVENNTEAVARALTLLITDPAKRETMGRAGYEKVTQNFSLKQFLDRTESIYRSSCNKR